MTSEIVRNCEEFLEEFYGEEIGELVDGGRGREARSLVVDWADLDEFDELLGEDHTRLPGQVKDALTDALAAFEDETGDLADVTVRVTDLPPEREYMVGEYLPPELNEAVEVKGQVAQVTQSKPEMTLAVFECTRCGSKTEIPQPEGSPDTREPHECAGCERQGPFVIDDSSEYRDSQVVRLQQPPEVARGNGSTVDVFLKNELASCELDGGDRVAVAGELTVDETDTEENVYDYQLMADSLTVENGGYGDIETDEFADEIEEIRSADDPVQVLVDNFAPTIEADDRLKTIQEALVLQMVGATRKPAAGGGTLRGDSHMLILGDPSTSKSVMLEEVEELAPRSELKSGEGLTKAGATAAAVKDDFGAGQWTAKAGLLVAANDGIACVDEVDNAEEEALNSMHQALENQRVTISKAGINGEMPARTTLLAAGNPKYDRFDPYEPVADQIELKAAMLSRFDLLFMLTDQVDADRDSDIAGAVITNWSESGRAAHTDEDVTRSRDRPICDDQDRAAAAIRAYIAHAKESTKPVFRSEEVMAAAEEAYMSVRLSGDPDDDAIPITTRKLEAFLRLAEASARARFSEEVELQDVERANRLVVESLKQTGTDPETGEFDADIIESGRSKSQRDRVKKMKTVVEEVEREHDDGAPRGEIARRATEHGVDTNRVDAELQKLAQKGELYEPQDGYYRTT